MDKNSPILCPSAPPCVSAELVRENKTEASKFLHGALTDRVIGWAIAVHKELGPGFLESIYEESFSLELDRQRFPHT